MHYGRKESVAGGAVAVVAVGRRGRAGHCATAATPAIKEEVSRLILFGPDSDPRSRPSAYTPPVISPF